MDSRSIHSSRGGGGHGSNGGMPGIPGMGIPPPTGGPGGPPPPPPLPHHHVPPHHHGPPPPSGPHYDDRDRMSGHIGRIQRPSPPLTDPYYNHHHQQPPPHHSHQQHHSQHPPHHQQHPQPHHAQHSHQPPPHHGPHPSHGIQQSTRHYKEHSRSPEAERIPQSYRPSQSQQRNESLTPLNLTSRSPVGPPPSMYPVPRASTPDQQHPPSRAPSTGSPAVYRAPHHPPPPPSHASHHPHPPHHQMGTESMMNPPPPHHRSMLPPSSPHRNTTPIQQQPPPPMQHQGSHQQQGRQHTPSSSHPGQSAPYPGSRDLPSLNSTAPPPPPPPPPRQTSGMSISAMLDGPAQPTHTGPPKPPPPPEYNPSKRPYTPDYAHQNGDRSRNVSIGNSPGVMSSQHQGYGPTGGKGRATPDAYRSHLPHGPPGIMANHSHVPPRPVSQPVAPTTPHSLSSVLRQHQDEGPHRGHVRSVSYHDRDSNVIRERERDRDRERERERERERQRQDIEQRMFRQEREERERYEHEMREHEIRERERYDREMKEREEREREHREQVRIRENKERERIQREREREMREQRDREIKEQREREMIREQREREMREQRDREIREQREREMMREQREREQREREMMREQREREQREREMIERERLVNMHMGPSSPHINHPPQQHGPPAYHSHPLTSTSNSHPSMTSAAPPPPPGTLSHGPPHTPMVSGIATLPPQQPLNHNHGPPPPPPQTSSSYQTFGYTTTMPPSPFALQPALSLPPPPPGEGHDLRRQGYADNQHGRAEELLYSKQMSERKAAAQSVAQAQIDRKNPLLAMGGYDMNRLDDGIGGRPVSKRGILEKEDKEETTTVSRGRAKEKMEKERETEEEGAPSVVSVGTGKKRRHVHVHHHHPPHHHPHHHHTHPHHSHDNDDRFLLDGGPLHSQSQSAMQGSNKRAMTPIPVHHHYPPRHHSPAPQPPAKRPKLIINSTPVVQSVANLPRYHLGSMVYNPSGNTNASSKGYSTTHSMLPRFEGRENCIFQIRVPRRYLYERGRSDICKRRWLWGSDVYTDDSDVLAVLVHLGKIPPALPEGVEPEMVLGPTAGAAEERDKEVGRKGGRISGKGKAAGNGAWPHTAPATTTTDKVNGATSNSASSSNSASGYLDINKDIIVDILILPPLEKYSSTVRNAIKSRSWVKQHDGMSYMVHEVKTAEPGEAEGRGKGMRKQRLNDREHIRKWGTLPGREGEGGLGSLVGREAKVGA